MNVVCCIFNVAPLYNSAIYNLIDSEVGSDFFIGDKISTPIKLMHYESLQGFKFVLKNVPIFHNFYWQKGALSTVFKSYRHYIISGEPYCISTWIILVCCKLLNKKTYLWSHGWYGDETYIKKHLKFFFFRLSSKVFLYGEYSKVLMINEGFDPDDLVVIYNSLNDVQVDYYRSRLVKGDIYKRHFKNDYPVLIYVGRIQQTKKIDLVLRAMVLLKNDGFQCNFILIGDNVDDLTLEAKITDYGLSDQIWIYGSCFEDEELSNLIYNADLCVSPGNVGLTAIHSLTYGTPVITHNNAVNQGPEFEAIIPWETGIFFDENSEKDLSFKINIFLNFIRKKKEHFAQKCFDIIDKKYNSSTQIEIIKENLVNYGKDY